MPDTPKAGNLTNGAPTDADEGVESPHNTDMSRIYGPFGYLKELFQRFGGDQCGSWAAALSFFSILSIAPVLLCGLAVLGFLIHDPDTAARHVQDIIARIVPDPDSAHAVMAQLNVEKSAKTLVHTRGLAGVVGVLSLFWAAMQIFVNASAPMNASFRTRESRGWINLRLTSLGLLFITGLLFLLSIVLTTALQYTSDLANHLLIFQSQGSTVKALIDTFFFLIGLILSLTANGVMFAVIYKYLPAPESEVSWKAAAISGAIIALLWEAAKQAFALYLAKFANYNKLYGSLGGLIALIFWIYYSSMILLLGAEIAKLYQDAKGAQTPNTKPRKKPVRSR